MRWLNGLMVLIFLAASNPVPSAQAFQTSADQERRLWHRAAQQQTEFEQRRTILHNPQLTTNLASMISRIWKHVQTDLPPLTIRVIEGPDLDAFTYPNGVCYITTGMLVHIRNADQLAMVLSHEIIHYTHRHTLRSIDHVNTLGFQPDNHMSKFAQKETSPPPADVVAMVNDAEREADRYGLDLMKKAGYDPGRVVALLQGFPCGRSGHRKTPSRMHPYPHSKDRLWLIESIVSDSTYSDIARDGCIYDPHYRMFVKAALLANSRVSVQLGRFDQAEENLCEYMAFGVAEPEAYFLRGELQRHASTTSATQEALKAYQQAILIDHAFAPAYRELGVVHFKLGHMKKARRFFETFLDLTPQGEGNQFVRGYLNLCAK